MLIGKLNPKQTADVINILSAQNIDYDLSPNNDAVFVGNNDLATSRMLLAANGTLGSESVGFEIFDSASYGMTEFSQRIYYQRALQGELENSIRTLTAIRGVRVHLVLPENTLFKSKDDIAKASVIVAIKEFSTLNRSEVWGIQQLVAASVPKLTTAQVTVMDANGRLLTGNNSENLLAGDNFHFQKLLESHYRKKISDIVYKLVGVGDAVISVNAAIDFSKIESTTQSAIPIADKETGVLVRSKVDRTYSPGRSEEKIIDGNAHNKRILSESEQNEYQYSSEVKKTQAIPGRVENLTVSVLITKEFNKKELSSIEALIKQAIGFNQSRGDKVSVAVIRPSIHDSKEAEGVRVPDIGGEALPRPDDMENEKLPNSGLRKTPKLLAAKVLGIPIWLYLPYFIILGLVLVFFIRKAQRKRLSDSERVALLGEMRNWLEADASENFNYAKQIS